MKHTKKLKSLFEGKKKKKQQNQGKPNHQTGRS